MDNSNQTLDKSSEDIENSSHSPVPPKSPYLQQEINTFLTSIPILLCCFTSGLIDSNVFNAWGVFASMQTGIITLRPYPNLTLTKSFTGNTVILALGASHRPAHSPHAWLQALVAILFFFLGAFFSSRVFGMLFSPLKRWSLAASFGLQAILIAIAAAMVQGSVVPGLDPQGTENFIQVVPLAMLAFQAGQQCVAARELGLNEIPTTVLTSVYCDLGNDHQLFAPLTSNWKRNRRFASAVLLLLGAIFGGLLSRTGIGMAAGLWLAAGVKFGVSISWIFWAADKELEEKA
jgi:uncharacterized membrane protein YoaK (UPF0700 family)